MGIFSRLSRFGARGANQAPTPPSRPTPEDYPRLFDAAVARTRKLGLYSENFKPLRHPLIDQSRINEIGMALRRIVDTGMGGDPRGLSGQCFAVSRMMAEQLAGAFDGHAPVFTIGSVYGPESRLFGVDLPVLEARLRGKDVEIKERELHAWLTLPSYEIIDATFSTSASNFTSNGEGVGGVIARSPMELKGMVFEPLFVGGGVLDLLGLMRLGRMVAIF